MPVKRTSELSKPFNIRVPLQIYDEVNRFIDDYGSSRAEVYRQFFTIGAGVLLRYLYPERYMTPEQMAAMTAELFKLGIHGFDISNIDPDRYSPDQRARLDALLETEPAKQLIELHLDASIKFKQMLIDNGLLLASESEQKNTAS